jgi:hypothetical protein
MNLGSTTWTSNLAYCPSITYEIIDQSTGLTADAIFYITSGSLMVNTADKTKIKTYNLIVTGSIIGTYKTYL